MIIVNRMLPLLGMGCHLLQQPTGVRSMRIFICSFLAIGALLLPLTPSVAEQQVSILERLVFPPDQPTLPVLKWRRPPAIEIIGPLPASDRGIVDHILSLGLQSAALTSPAPGPGGPQIVILASRNLLAETERRLRGHLLRTRAGDPAEGYAHVLKRITDSPSGCTGDLVVDVREIRAFFLFIDLANPAVDAASCIRRALLSTFNIRNSETATENDIRETIRLLYAPKVLHGDDRPTLLAKIK